MDPKTVFGQQEELRILDVREPFEYQAGHIEGVQHIPMGDIPTRVDEVDDSKPLLAICRSGKRSAHVVAFLKDKGFDISNLEGGMKAWAKAGLPVVDASGAPGKVV